MSDQTRRVWRAGPVTLVLVSAFALAAGVVIPILAYLIYRNDSTLWLPALFVMLTVLALLYAWRFGLHPRLEVTDQNVKIINPFRRYSFEWDDITVIAPGENGLLIGSEDNAAEVWCVQKSKFASQRGRLTRADRIANQLLDIVELHDPPTEDERLGHVSAARVLTRAGCSPGWNVRRARRRWPISSRPSSIRIRPAPSPGAGGNCSAIGSCMLTFSRYATAQRATSLSTGIPCTTSASCRTSNGADTAQRYWSSPASRSSGAVPGKRSVGCWPTIAPHARSIGPAIGLRPARCGNRSIPRTLSQFS